jgi:Ca2+-binding RTX toxin-like protein
VVEDNVGTYTGTSANDTITPELVSAGVIRVPAGSTPSLAADVINGLGGNDDLNGGGGADTINGGDGNDKVYIDVFDQPLTFTGTATLHGNAGDDTLSVLFDGPDFNIDAGTFRLYGDAGNDILRATYFYPWSEGPNYGAANDVLYGGTGNDHYVLQEHSDVVVEKAGEGYDSVEGWGDDYTLAANVEKLQLFYGPDDAPYGYHGTGNALANVIIGTQADDTLDGAGGNDTIYGKPIGENYDWNDDADVIRGGSGNDVIYGGGGAKETWDGNDTLYGDDGNDRVYAQFGNDRLTGGAGLDQLSGGPGNDIFDYNAVSESKPGAASRDVVLDFVGVGAAAGDRVDLSTIDANTTKAGNQAFVFKGAGAITGAGQVHVVASGADTLIQANTGGTTAPELEILVKDGTATPAQWVGGDFIL